ncbi:hypothetical protein KDW_28170 [Dictyobacter vulcani]|uniref:Uncharacterized protein n=1 Tax=Dictyobacter vulcani TaxID=2607529 RepID=A0A5J4KLC3_9CHLR|nr:hypothetical protein KDW_28170 [Dictyobacter vulcani]
MSVCSLNEWRPGWDAIFVALSSLYQPDFAAVEDNNLCYILSIEHTGADLEYNIITSTTIDQCSGHRNICMDDSPAIYWSAA